jgi:alkylation response protein AidB-like acyl-CoA dehydrogenase
VVHDFVDKEIMPVREQLEHDVELQNKIRQLLMDIGLQRLCTPKEYGGGGV